jgi:hypothetical protein
MPTRGRRVYDYLVANPGGATWRDLASHLGITWAHRVLDSGHQEVRAAVTEARHLAQLNGQVIPRPTALGDWLYKVEDKVGSVASFDATILGWITAREDAITRQRTLITQGQTLRGNLTLSSRERVRLGRQLVKDRGHLIDLEDDLAAVRAAFR